MDKIGEIILVILTSVGGISGIIIIAVKFCSNIIAKRLEEKYSLKLSKELELFKSNIENKIYISRTKFDTEFQIYRDLSKAFFEAVKNVSIMIPSGVAIYPADKEEKRKYEEKLYNLAKESTVKAQDVLHSNAPFISTELFDEFDNILVICRQQLGVFEERWNVYNFSTQEEKESFSREDYKRTDELNDSFRVLNERKRSIGGTLVDLPIFLDN